MGELITEGFHPILFCRFIPTAEYVADELRKKLRGVEVVAVTGNLPPDEREERVLQLAESEKREGRVDRYGQENGINRRDATWILRSFPIVKRKDIQRHGRLCTKRVILEIYDEMKRMKRAMETHAAYQTRLDPPPANGWTPPEPPKEEVEEKSVAESEMSGARQQPGVLFEWKVEDRNVSITLRHLGEKFRLQEEAQRPFPTAAAGG